MLLTNGDTRRVKEVTVLGLGTMIVTLVLANAFRLDLEMDADALVKVWAVNDWRGTDDWVVT